MKVYLAVSVSLIPPIIEVFSNETDRNAFAFGYRRQKGIVLFISTRDVHETTTETETNDKTRA